MSRFPFHLDPKTTAECMLSLILFALAFSTSVVHASGPILKTYDSAGKRKDIFSFNETMYIMGSGFFHSSSEISVLRAVDIYLVEDVVTWKDRTLIPPRVRGTIARISTDSSGNIPLTAVWTAPLRAGAYDIVADVDGNGRYDIDVDALDDANVNLCPTQHYGVLVVPEYWLGSVLGLAGCLAAFGVFPLTKRKR
jgi:hypothetical protein